MPTALRARKYNKRGDRKALLSKKKKEKEMENENSSKNYSSR